LYLEELLHTSSSPFDEWFKNDDQFHGFQT